MTNFAKGLIPVLLIFGLSTSFAGDPLKWPKIQFEEKIRERVAHTLGQTLAPGTFLVQVNAELGGLAGDKEEDKKEVNRTPATEAPTPEEERVYLGKLDMMDEGFSVTEAATAEAGMSAFAAVLAHLKKLTVKVTLDTKVPEGKKDLVQSLLKTETAGLSSEPPEVIVEKGDVAIPPVDKEVGPSESEWNLKRWLSEFKMPLGMITATLLFCVILGGTAFVISGGFRKVANRLLSVLEAKAQTATEVSLKGDMNEAIKNSGDRGISGFAGAESTNAGSIDGATVLPSSEKEQSGFARFRVLLAEDPAGAGGLVRSWVKAPGPEARMALCALSRILDTEHLSQLLENLGESDRLDWRSILMTGGEVVWSSANDFVGRAVVESLLAPNGPTMDQKIKVALAELKVEECAEIALRDVGFGAILANVLPTSLVGQMLSALPDDVAASITTASAKLNSDELAAGVPKIRGVLEELRSRRAKAKPFIRKAVELIRELGARKEGPVFDSIIESGDEKVLAEVARRYIPAELFFKFPPRVVKQTLERLPLAKRGEFIAPLEGEEREAALRAFGEAESKGRELIEMEVMAVESDPDRMARAVKHKNKNFGEAVESLRRLVAMNPSVYEQIEGVLNKWLFEKTNGKVGGAEETGFNVAA